MEGDFIDTFRRYIPKSEVEALKADLAEGIKQEREAEANKEGTAAVGPVSDEGQAGAGKGK